MTPHSPQLGGPPSVAEPALPAAAAEADVAASDAPVVARCRYQAKEDDAGPYLACVEAPEVKVRLDRNLTVTASAARKAPEGTIYLDGAAQGAPFLDHERRVFNLDHHEGCERRFTLATCEQALVLVLRGLDLRERPWTVYANAPDLDTVLALWVLLNSQHLGPQDAAIRRAVVPLVRLEGIIDAQGLELVELSGFSDERLETVTGQLDRLRELELALLGDGQCDSMECAIGLLNAVDELIFPEDHLQPLPPIEELAREELTDRRIIVVCRAEGGIYELEPMLKRLYGKRLGLIALQKDERTYTLRQVDGFLPVNLEAAYAKLNLLEPAAGGARSADRWGGSGEIGGSPRSSGTDLKPAEIAAICRLAYRKQPLKARAAAAGRALWKSTAALAAGWLGAGALVGLAPWRWSGGWLGSPLAFAGFTLAVTCAIVVLSSGRLRRRLYGLQLPVGIDWLWAAIPVVAGAFLGGSWAAPAGALAEGWQAAPIGAALLVLLTAEIVFRGLVYGNQVLAFEVQTYKGRWFLSWPAILSTALYAFWTLPLGHPSPSLTGLAGGGAVAAAAGALLAGLGLAVARERSGSLLAPLLLHAAAAGLTLLVRLWLG